MPDDCHASGTCGALCLDLHVADRARTAGENVALVDFVVENATIVVHLYFTGNLHHPAGAA